MSTRTTHSFRAPAIAGAVALAAALLVPFGPSAPAAVAAVGECPTGTIPAPGTPATNTVWSDANAAVYAGGDFVADGAAAESEGVLVVAGDATFAKDAGGTFNVGWVGVGSQVAPPPGTTMLAVGGSLAVGATTILDIGSGAAEPGGPLLGGNAEVGGTTSPAYPAAQYELNNGSLAAGLGADALGDYAGFGDLIADTSAELANEPDTGTVAVDGNRVTFTGSGAPGLQVFTITAAQASAITEVYFVGIADDAPVVVNVTGGPTVTMAHNYVANDGVRADDLTSPLFGMVAARTLWNFVDATTVNLHGTSQLLGSILAPTADLDIVASTNGRVYAGGDIRMHGTGNELHNYPWISAPFECVPTTNSVTGSVTLQKLLADGSEAFLPVGPSGLPKFAGDIECALGDGGTLVERWTLRPPNTITIEGLPVGAECTITEDLSAVTQDRDGTADVPLADLEWAAPIWTVDGQPAAAPVTFTVPNPEQPAQVDITVTNELLLGSFTIAKAVENPGQLAYADTFTGAWSCTHPDIPAGTDGMSGTWSLASGASSPSFTVPLGSQCEVTEDAAADPEGGTWLAPVISGSPASITAGSSTEPVQVLVTNTLTPGEGPGPGPGPEPGPGPDAGSELPATGTTVPWWAIGVGGMLLVAGAVVVILGMLRRRRS